MYCPNCGKQVSNSDLFCPYCGISLDDSTKSEIILDDSNVFQEKKIGEEAVQDTLRKKDRAFSNTCVNLKLKKASTIFFIISCASLLVSTIVYLIVILSGDVFDLERDLSFYWIYFCFLPFTIISFILAIALNTQTHRSVAKIVLSAIFTVILLESGASMGLANTDSYFHREYSYAVQQLNDIHFPYKPTKGNFETFDPFGFTIYSKMTFTDEEEIAGFEAAMNIEIEQGRFLDCKESVKHSIVLDEYDYIAFYSVSSGRYASPDSDDPQTYIFYDFDSHTMLILRIDLLEQLSYGTDAPNYREDGKSFLALR